ncbi:hypothetical protein L7F22_046977 [Adiantum nelumboides]|nr:hypothetical protein [Adiantum nelumboides]
MESQTDFFHLLPDEVAQLIFSCINDYKALIHCMSVSKYFRQQAARVPSLLIVCPGSFSSYDERLHRIFAMVKAFKNLKSLVVRVGQPREEPPSWARCMRYAEIGGSVEKFMFMAAKCGDFSELDSMLLGLDTVGDKQQEGASMRSHSVGPLSHTELDGEDSTRRSYKPDRNRGHWDDAESNENGFETGAPDGPVLEAVSKQIDQGKQSIYNRLASFNGSIKRNPLSQFALRQVIAPSNDVLKRMLPVIHFAIVQGLNELRDSLPAFVAQFTELRAFLLVDMVESITVFTREHHIQELKSSYMQELNELSSLAEEVPKAEWQDQVKGLSGKNEEKGLAAMSSNSGYHEASLEDSMFADCLPRKEDSMFRNDITVSDDSCLRRNIEEPQSFSSNMLPSRLSQKCDTRNLQASKGKQKLAEENGLERECRFTSLHMDLRCNDYSGLDSLTGSGEGSSLDGCLFPPEDGAVGSSLNDGAFGLESSPSESFHSNPLLGETILESYAPLEGFDISTNDHLVSSEVVIEHLDTANGKLDCRGEDHGKARANGCRLHGNKGSRDSKLDLTNKYSLRRCHKPDGWKKKDCTNLRFLTGSKGTGSLYCNNFQEENLAVQGSQMHPRCNAFDKIEQDSTVVGGGSDDTKSREHRGGVSENLYCATSNRVALSAVQGSQTNEQQISSSSSPPSLQALQSEANGSTGERVAHIDSWQERLRRLRDTLHVEPLLEPNRSLDSQQSQSLEVEFPESVEERAVRADSWRQVWQERVRRLRDSLHMDPGQELDRTYEHRRVRLRDLVIKKRHRAMEKDALSFDYTFWRAEQVSSCDYVMSDISMCIATHTARPLRDAEKEVLAQAAISGPLLVATVSHVNKHYPCHQL